MGVLCLLFRTPELGGLSQTKKGCDVAHAQSLESKWLSPVTDGAADSILPNRCSRLAKSGAQIGFTPLSTWTEGFQFSTRTWRWCFYLKQSDSEPSTAQREDLRDQYEQPPQFLRLTQLVSEFHRWTKVLGPTITPFRESVQLIKRINSKDCWMNWCGWMDRCVVGCKIDGSVGSTRMDG